MTKTEIEGVTETETWIEGLTEKEKEIEGVTETKKEGATKGDTETHRGRGSERDRDIDR